MTDIKSKLKGSQGGSDFVKLPILKTYSVKEVNGEPMFLYWNKEKEENETTDNIFSKGIYIGGAMRLTAYDDNLGAKGGNFFSNYYFNRESVVLFKPGKTTTVACKGNMDEVEKWIASNTTSKIAKKKWCFFILTKNGLVEVQTNLSIAIDHIKKFKDPLTEKYCILTPAMFTPDTKDISNSCKQMLGKFATKNPPAYASLSVDEMISEDDFDNWGAVECIDTYNAWKKQISTTPDKTEHKEPDTEIPDDYLPPDMNPDYERIP